MAGRRDSRRPALVRHAQGRRGQQVTEMFPRGAAFPRPGLETRADALRRKTSVWESPVSVAFEVPGRHGLQHGTSEDGSGLTKGRPCQWFVAVRRFAAVRCRPRRPSSAACKAGNEGCPRSGGSLCLHRLLPLVDLKNRRAAVVQGIPRSLAASQLQRMSPQSPPPFGPARPGAGPSRHDERFRSFRRSSVPGPSRRHCGAHFLAPPRRCMAVAAVGTGLVRAPTPSA